MTKKKRYKTETIEAGFLKDEEIIGKKIIGWDFLYFPEQQLDELIIDLEDGKQIEIRLLDDGTIEVQSD